MAPHSSRLGGGGGGGGGARALTGSPLSLSPSLPLFRAFGLWYFRRRKRRLCCSLAAQIQFRAGPLGGAEPDSLPDDSSG